MENMIKTFIKRLVPFFACSVGVTLLLSYEFIHGLLSPRRLGLALLILCIASGLGDVLIIKKSAKEFAIPPLPPRTPIDAFDRKLLLRVVRKAKIRIATMAVHLVLGMGLPEIRNVPVWAASGLRSESTGGGTKSKHENQGVKFDITIRKDGRQTKSPSPRASG